MKSNEEQRRLAVDQARGANWKRWGPYLSERQWGTVREDYSPNGTNWEYFDHEQSRSRAYRWGEDGLLGISDRECRLCFSVALWNGADSILKERLFGVTNHQGNHGEDVKEQYFYLDSTPTHSYLKALYKYPQRAFPYEQLLAENARRSRDQGEFELVDTGAFDQSRYFDVQVEYAKATPDDILIKLTVTNHGPDQAFLHLLPTLWFRNTWSWGRSGDGYWNEPQIKQLNGFARASHESLGNFNFVCENPDFEPLYTNNETNNEKLFQSKNKSDFVKDAFHQYVVESKSEAVNPELCGTKAAFYSRLSLSAGASMTFKYRLQIDDRQPLGASSALDEQFGDEFDSIFSARIGEANQFYNNVLPAALTPEQATVSRQAYAGLLWSKQFYHYIVSQWLEGDPGNPPQQRQTALNQKWKNIFNRDIISMPDKWEYPWYAIWDVAFHMIVMAQVDATFAKEQLILFLREWYMRQDGQLPAYEFDFADLNPPVHAWAAFRVYKMTAPRGMRDLPFLERVFQKLLINFTWWVNRKDVDGNDLFGGGFLGLDNIGIFDRSKGVIPFNGVLQQADGTAWMSFYCTTMLAIALELAEKRPAHEDIASKFFEHFVQISDAIHKDDGSGLWCEEDGFYYDHLHITEHHTQSNIPLRVRSIVGLIPLLAVEVLEEPLIKSLPGFYKRMMWFIKNRSDLDQNISLTRTTSRGESRLLSLLSSDRLKRVLAYMLDENEFLSPYGIRSLSKIHEENPLVFSGDGETYEVKYAPGESDTAAFGGNSNWRGPIWFPLNYLIIEALERYHSFYGEDFKVECPTASGNFISLKAVAQELARRLSSIFLADGQTQVRPWQKDTEELFARADWQDLHLFYEYFHAESGRGLGASHQTGWTALITRLFSKCNENSPGENENS